MAETKPVQSLLRGVEVLRLLVGAQHGMRLQELAQLMELKTPTVHNIVKTLSIAGLVEKLSSNHYAATLSLVELGDAVRHNRQHVEIEKLMRQLATTHKQAVINYARPSQTALAVVLRMSPDQPRVMQYPSGRQYPLYASATGLAFLSFASQEDVCAMREYHPFHDRATHHWKSPAELDSYLSKQRKQGYAETQFARQELYRISVPVYDNQNQLSGFFGAAIGIQHLPTRKAQRAFAKELRDLVQSLDAALFAGPIDG